MNLFFLRSSVGVQRRFLDNFRPNVSEVLITQQTLPLEYILYLLILTRIPTQIFSFQSDFYWLMKMSYVWSDISKLRLDMSKSSTDTLRYRLLTAAVNMQSALGRENRFYFEYAKLIYKNKLFLFILLKMSTLD